MKRVTTPPATFASAPDSPDSPNSPDSTGRFSDATKAAIAAGVTVLVWASAFVVIRDAGASLSPGPLALLRLVVAAAALSLLALAQDRRGRRMPRSARSIGLVAAFGVLWLAGYTVALNAGERHVDAGTAALLVNIAPVLIALGAGLLLGEGFPRTLFIGLAVALGGVTIIAMDSSVGGDGRGVLYCLAAAVLFTAGMLIQKVTLRHVDAFTATWLACVAGTIALLPWTPQLIDELRTASTGAIVGAVYLGLFPTAVGFVAWAYALGHTSTGKLSATTYAVPAVSVLLSWRLLAEAPTALGLTGGAICLVGVALSRRRGRSRPAGGRQIAKHAGVFRNLATPSGGADGSRASAAPSPPGRPE